jgi:hypothetical protein
VRTSLNFIRTDFKGGANGSVTRQNENVFLTRARWHSDLPSSAASSSALICECSQILCDPGQNSFQ